MSPPFPIVCVRPAGIQTQIELPLHPRRHLVGRGWVWFLWLGIRSNKPVVAIPVRASVRRDGVSHGVETISNKVPIIAIRLDEVFQELVVLWGP